LSPIPSVVARRHRVLTRALPLVVTAIAAFVAGMIIGRTGLELSRAERFASAWERGDYKAMYAELSPPAADSYSLKKFESAYRQAQETATIERLEAGQVTSGTAQGGGDAAIVPLTFHTNVFGALGGDLTVPLAGDRVDWTPNLVFPGLARGQHLVRRSRVPERAPILARDGTSLAEGPASARTSPLGAAAQAIVGVTGTTSGREAKRLGVLGFPPGTAAGTTGLELAFNDRLAGRPGGQLLAAGSGGGGAAPHILAQREPRKGEPVRTTIDPNLQRATVAALGDTYGGAVALDAKTGDVLAAAGLAFSAPQPPGSTFKVITTTAALDAGVVKLSDTFPIQTSSVVDGREIANANNESCGGTFVEAFAESCNSVFAPLGPKIGSARLVSTAEHYGFNATPSLYDPEAAAAVDLPQSTIPKSIPSDLDLAVSAIGQGQVLATPLEMASVAQTVAGGGTRSPTPIVRDPELQGDAKPVEVTSEATANTLRDLMIQVVTQGTGTAAAIPGVQVAGKTGTAELGPAPLKPGEAARGETPAQKKDAWFTAFAPAGAPKLVAAAMVVNASGAGGEVAAPIVRQVLEAGL
jgi:peptidoglycan glycosyltransferase